MKKLLGVMILATLPVACGTTTNPNAPELPATADVTSAVPVTTSEARTAPPTCIPVTQVLLDVTRRSGGAQLSAYAVGLGTSGAPCGSPTWSVTPEGRGVRLTASLGRNNAFLEAPSGTYVVTVSYPGPLTDVTGSATVSFR
jgi:hypothetical protein